MDANGLIHPMIYVWGKLKPGVTVEQARAEMKTIAARLEKTYRETNGKETAIVTPLLENLVGKYRINLTLAPGRSRVWFCSSLARTWPTYLPPAARPVRVNLPFTLLSARLAARS